MRLCFAVLALAVCTACPKRIAKACETPPPLYVSLEADSKLNPDARGHPLPTEVQVIQLKDTARLERAGFRELWEKTQEMLGEDLIQITSFTLSPGSESSKWIQRDPKARFVLAMGRFRQPLGYAWRTVYELRPVPDMLCFEQDPSGNRGPPTNLDERVKFQLQGYQIDLVTPEMTGAAPAIWEPTASQTNLAPGRSG